MKTEFEGRRRTVSSYWTLTLFPGRCACTLEKIEYIIIIDNNNNNDNNNNKNNNNNNKNNNNNLIAHKHDLMCNLRTKSQQQQEI